MRNHAFVFRPKEPRLRGPDTIKPTVYVVVAGMGVQVRGVGAGVEGGVLCAGAEASTISINAVHRARIPRRRCAAVCFLGVRLLCSHLCVCAQSTGA